MTTIAVRGRRRHGGGLGTALSGYRQWTANLDAAASAIPTPGQPSVTAVNARRRPRPAGAGSRRCHCHGERDRRHVRDQLVTSHSSGPHHAVVVSAAHQHSSQQRSLQRDAFCTGRSDDTTRWILASKWPPRHWRKVSHRFRSETRPERNASSTSRVRFWFCGSSSTPNLWNSVRR